MKHWPIFILFCYIFCSATDISNAAGMIYRVQQMKAMKQQQAQAEYQHEYQQSQQQGTQDQGQESQTPLTYQQKIDQRNQAIAQSIHDERHQNGTGNDVQADNSTGENQVQQKPSPAVDATSADVKDVVDLAEVWKKLDQKSTVWPLLIDEQSKVLTVAEYIDRYHKQGVRIAGPPEHYVQVIDQIVGGNPQMLDRPFGELVQIVAIVDYDFDNGMDKDDLARHVLGEAGFEANKRRFTK